MKRIFRLLIINILTFSSIAVAFRFYQPAFNFFLHNVPDVIQSKYIDYVLWPRLGIFRGCQSKTIVFKAIGEKSKYGHSLIYNKRLLLPYVTQLDSDFSDKDCPGFMEPFPYVARAALFEDRGFLFLEIIDEENNQEKINVYCDVYRKAIKKISDMIEIQKCDG